MSTPSRLLPLATVVVAALTALPGPAAPAQEPAGLAFARAARCALCHSESPRASAMRDASGASVAPFELWRSSMMASSARDPLWRAVLSAEVAALPTQREAIETKCLRCHAPALAATPEGTLDARASLEELGSEAMLADIAREGVTCLVCHQVLPDGLGRPESFTAGLRLGLDRRAFGPHARPFANPMRMHSGFTPTEGDQLLRSSLCGTCHTVFTPAFTDEGEPLGVTFPEQTPYLEWRSSAYCDEGSGSGPLAATCQDCHLPKHGADGRRIETRIARNPGGRDFRPTRARQPYGRHVLVGGNTLVPALLAEHGDELGAPAPAEAYRAKTAAAREQLHSAALLRIVEVERVGDGLSFAVEVANLAGHKLPTGHPTRRAWLRVRVLGPRGEVLLASGDHDARGRILGADGRPAPEERAGGPTWPHRTLIDGPGQVQVWEAVMEDALGRPTWRLLAGTRWRVDDRLLPVGFAPSREDAPHVAPHGVEGDDDFVAGSDRVGVRVGGPLPAGALEVEAQLLHQPLGARWLDELRAVDTPEVRRLEALLETTSLPTEQVAAVRIRIEP